MKRLLRNTWSTILLYLLVVTALCCTGTIDVWGLCGISSNSRALVDSFTQSLQSTLQVINGFFFYFGCKVLVLDGSQSRIQKRRIARAAASKVLLND
jgi:hypothetical protein